MLRLRPPPAPGLKGFLKNRSGATALEFALVATPFFFMILCIVELGLVFLVTTALDNATQEAARQVRTGQSMTYVTPTDPSDPSPPPPDPHPMTASDFGQLVCSQTGVFASVLADCAANVAVDVRPFTAFTNQTAPDPAASGTFDPSKLVFNTGGPGDVILVRTFYKWKLITPVLYGGLQRMPGSGVDLITSVSTFRNEPFTPAAPPAPPTP